MVIDNHPPRSQWSHKSTKKSMVPQMVRNGPKINNYGKNYTGLGFPVRTKGTGNTWEQGTGNREQVTRRPAGPPGAKLPQKFFLGGGILKGTGNREEGTGNMPCSPSVPGTCSGTTPGKPIPGKIHQIINTTANQPTGRLVTVDIDGRFGSTYREKRSISTICFVTLLRINTVDTYCTFFLGCFHVRAHRPI